MEKELLDHTDLQSKILKALATLDEKGTDKQITKAMTIVFEAFRLNLNNPAFSVDELVLSACVR